MRGERTKSGHSGSVPTSVSLTPINAQDVKGGNVFAVDRTLHMMLALKNQIPTIRDIRAIAALLALADPNNRSLRDQPGISVEFLAGAVNENTEVARHLLKNLEIAGLATCCGKALRTHLYVATEAAYRALWACSIASERENRVRPETLQKASAL